MGVYYSDTAGNKRQKEKSYTWPQKRNDYSFPSTDNGLFKSNGGSQKTTEHLQENNCEPRTLYPAKSTF